MKTPAFQFYPGDWLSSAAVMCMTPAQEGAYIRLLCFDWNSDGIPDDDDALATLSRLGEGWLKGGSTVVRKCFNQHPTKPGFLTNPRIQKEREKQAEWRAKSAEGGKKSGEARKNQSKSKREPNVKGGSRVVAKWLNQKATLQSSSSSSIDSDNTARPTESGPPLAEVEAEFNRCGGTALMAAKFHGDNEAMGWTRAGQPIRKWRAMVSSYVATWRANEFAASQRAGAARVPRHTPEAAARGVRNAKPLTQEEMENLTLIEE